MKITGCNSCHPVYKKNKPNSLYRITLAKILAKTNGNIEQMPYLPAKMKFDLEILKAHWPKEPSFLVKYITTKSISSLKISESISCNFQNPTDFCCTLCGISFENFIQMMDHCREEAHGFCGKMEIHFQLMPTLVVFLFQIF